MQSFTQAEDLLFHRLEDLHKNQTEVANKIHDYTKLKSDLTEISKHSSKRVMIPICEGEDSIAFFTEGYLKHTNEVLVHLGSNYFVQRTAAECEGIIDRRLEHIKKQEQSVASDILKFKQMTAIIHSQQSPQVTTEGSLIKSEKGHARLNQEGLLEIEEPVEEDAPKRVEKSSKKFQAREIQYVGDPFSNVKSPA